MNLSSTDLANTELFRNAPEAILQMVLQQSKPVRLAAGEILLSPERDNHHVYLLLSGSFGLHFNSPHSPEIRELSAGTSVGEMSVIDWTKPSAYVIAKTPSRVLPIHRDIIQQLVEDANPIACNLLRLMTRWIKANTQRIIEDQARIFELSCHANVDSLTGLYNRRWLDNAFGRLLEQSQKEDRPLCLLLIDVDHFKAYNDGQGHPGGDQALIALGNVLKTTLRPYDFSVRYGGEEFLVLLPNTGKEEGITVAERIRRKAADKKISFPDHAPLPGITVSIGLAVSDVTVTPVSLIAAADVQLYRAKTAGRNRVCG
ncbi:MAG: GGDEF domain-containing protein [Methylococcaceae bacterium]|nr:MAG: GGDEF domain-containing protein [Methylococcaceae bacterium]